MLKFILTIKVDFLWFCFFELNKKTVILDLFPYDESNSRHNLIDGFLINRSIIICFCYATEDGFDCKKLFGYLCFNFGNALRIIRKENSQTHHPKSMNYTHSGSSLSLSVLSRSFKLYWKIILQAIIKYRLSLICNTGIFLFAVVGMMCNIRSNIFEVYWLHHTFWMPLTQ